jgi:hypothetical protein
MTAEAWSAVANWIVAAAASVAAVTAWKGLNTWKEQIQWEQGRGLAKSLLVSANQIRTQARAVRADFFFQRDQSGSQEDELVRFSGLQERVVRYVASFDESVNQFEQHTVEAKLLWKASFDEPLSELRDVAHTVRSYLYSGLGSVNPLVKEFDRRQATSAHTDFHPRIFNQDNIYVTLNAAILKIEKIVADMLPR